MINKRVRSSSQIGNDDKKVGTVGTDYCVSKKGSKGEAMGSNLIGGSPAYQVGGRQDVEGNSAVTLAERTAGRPDILKL